MDDFIKECKSNVNGVFSKCLVVGNCDGHFCSIMSAISLAFYMQNRRLHNEEDTIDFYIPVIPISRDLLDTKTDLLFYLEKYGVNAEDLLCMDDIFVENFDMLILVDLVSRHIYEEFDGNLVKMIFTLTYDEPDFEPAADCEILHKPAVAISTVVADYIVQHDPENLTDDDKLSLKILYDCTLYHIDNKREDEDLYPEDIQMLSDLEGFLGIPDATYAEDLITELLAAYDDYSHLNPMQLLYKFSAGTIYGAHNNKVVYIAYLPIRIKEFFEMAEFRTGVSEFAKWIRCNVMIIFGSGLDEQNNTKEDIAVISFRDNALYKKILDKLVYDSDMKLSYRGWFLGFGKWYRNYNPEVSIEKIRENIESILNVA